LRYRIRRLRLLARTITRIIDEKPEDALSLLPVRTAVYSALAPFLDAETSAFLTGIPTGDAKAYLAALAERRNLQVLDAQAEELLTQAFAVCRKADRRTVLLAYLGFPYFDIATLPMLQGEGLDEFDPIKVDRIAPDDAGSIRAGGAQSTLKGIEFNSFGAFFSRAYRENDYLWGRLHGAERMIDIVLSTNTQALPIHAVNAFKHRMFLAILDEERGRLTQIPQLFDTLQREISSGPLAKSVASA
jgi:Protein of unknown function (DUF3376)